MYTNIKYSQSETPKKSVTVLKIIMLKNTECKFSENKKDLNARAFPK